MRPVPWIVACHVLLILYKPKKVRFAPLKYPLAGGFKVLVGEHLVHDVLFGVFNLLYTELDVFNCGFYGHGLNLVKEIFYWLRRENCRLQERVE
jgi:hypothetical protein